MRCYLRSIETGLFFQARNVWVPSVAEAFDFREGDRAVAMGHELKLSNVEVFFVSPDGRPMFGARLDSINPPRPSLDGPPASP